jgi:heat shock protein HtpX
MDLIKLLVLATIPSAAIIGGGYAISEEATLFGCLFALILLASMYWLSDKVVLKMCRAELLTPYHSTTLFRLVNEVSQKMKIAAPKIYAIAGETPNVFSTGRSQRSAAIVFTEGILRSVSEDELRGIIAHELQHIKRHETLLHSIAAMIAGLLGIGISATAAEMSVDETDSRLRKARRIALGGYRYVMAPLPALVVQSLVNARREFRADELGAKLTENPIALANAIRAMEKKKYQMPLYVNPAVAHLFIVNPLTVGRIARLFSTHPPMEERIARLEQLTNNVHPAVSQQESTRILAVR